MAYGARLESVLGESPQGFESPILRVVMSQDIVDLRAASSWVFVGKIHVPSRERVPILIGQSP